MGKGGRELSVWCANVSVSVPIPLWAHPKPNKQIACPRGFVTEVNAFGYEACYASYKGGEDWRQGMLKVEGRGASSCCACDLNVSNHLPT